MKAILVILLALGIASVSNAQSAWVKSKGDVYTQLSFNTISNYTSIFNKNGEAFNTSRAITDRTVQWYTEYGLTNTITLVASIPFKLLKTGDLVPEYTNVVTIEEGDYSTFGNISLSARFKLPSKKYAITTQLQIDLPSGSFNSGTGLRSGIDTYSITPTIAFGKGSKNSFFQSYTGVSLRTNNYSNGFKFYIEGGKRFFNQLWLIAYIDVVDSLEDGNIVAPDQNLETFLYLNNNEFAGFGLKLIEELTPEFGITTAFGGAFPAHLEAQKASFNIGMYYKLLK